MVQLGATCFIQQKTGLENIIKGEALFTQAIKAGAFDQVALEASRLGMAHGRLLPSVEELEEQAEDEGDDAPAEEGDQ